MLRFPTRVAFSAMSAVVAAGIVAFADPANAAPVDADVAQRVVHFSDLDLATAHDRIAFQQRIASAADEVCPPHAGSHIQSERDACRRQAIAAANQAAGLGAE